MSYIRLVVIEVEPLFSPGGLRPVALPCRLATLCKETAMSKPHLLVHEKKDTVGVVVVEGLKAGTDMLCVVTHDNSDFRLTAKMDIPIGHKVALKDIKKGDTIWKYGQDIGAAKADVKQGEHLHVHNAKTKRW
jgi:(2R)-sulfolactate sulfo-lyase subunit alpha